MVPGLRPVENPCPKQKVKFRFLTIRFLWKKQNN